MGQPVDSWLGKQTIQGACIKVTKRMVLGIAHGNHQRPGCNCAVFYELRGMVDREVPM